MLRGAVYVNGRIARAEDATIPCTITAFCTAKACTRRCARTTVFPFFRSTRASPSRVSRLPGSRGSLHRRRAGVAWIADTMAAAGCLQEAYIRVLLTRGVGEFTYDLQSTPVPSLIIIVKPLEEPPARVLTDGIKVALVPILRNHPGSVNPIIKSNNLLNNALAMQEANRRGADEGLMCNYRGELSECSQSNFFHRPGGRGVDAEE